MRIANPYIVEVGHQHGTVGNLPYRVSSSRGRSFDTIQSDRFDWISTHFGPLSATWFKGCFEPDLKEIVVILAFMQKVPQLPDAREWFALHHQAGGHSCEQYYFVGTRIALRPPLYPVLRQIARDRYPGGRSGWDSSNFSAHALAYNQDEMQIYRSDIAELGLTYTGTWLTESMYPFDATLKNLRRITDEHVEMSQFGLNSQADVEDTGAVFLIVTSNSD